MVQDVFDTKVLHCIKYQLPTPYSFNNPDKILKVKGTTTRPKVKSRSHHDVTHLQAPTNVPTRYQLPTVSLQLPRYSPGKTLKVTTARSKVKSRLHHDIAHLQTPTNAPNKYQLPTPYSFQNIAQTRFNRSRSLWQGPRSNQGHTITLHTYTPDQLPTHYGFQNIARIKFYRRSIDPLL